MSFELGDLEHLFLVFCRVGSFLMVLPGFGSMRTPARVRLSIALVVSFAVAPLVPAMSENALRHGGGRAAVAIASEVATGLTIGMIGRYLFEAIHFAGNAASAMIGLTASIRPATEDDASTEILAEIFSALAIVLFFIADFHLLVLLALVRAYQDIPIGSAGLAGDALAITVGTLDRAFSAALQMVAPFVVYSVTANLVFAVINKLVPQFPAFFISIPFIIAGGLVLSYVALPGGIDLYMRIMVAPYANGFGS